MKALRNGDKGPDVKKWQYFLNGQGYTEIVADGHFGTETENATIQFQQKNGLSADGVVGTFTLATAGTLGFELVKNPVDTNRDGIHWPAKPDFRSLTQSQYREKFGKFSYSMKPGNNPGREIIVSPEWETENLVYINTPILQGLPPYRAGRMRVHKRVANQFQGLFEEWERAGLKNLLLSYDGGYYPRMIRGSETNLSSHSYGIAFDINAAYNGLGIIPPKAGAKGSVRPLVEAALKFGFYWGGHFSRYDGMHFEVARIMD
ncbi:MAG: M15 family metallopeptidase [Bacteroidota bacterium]